MSISPITPEEFDRFRRLIYDHAGISLIPEKKVMVASRLAKRLDYYGVSTYGEYFQLATQRDHPHEFQTMVNILTTNETYFFREPKHFDFFREEIMKNWRGEQFRLWSAASSSGEEAYSLAMVMAQELGMRRWEILGSDLSTRVLDIAKQGVYTMDRLEQMDMSLMAKYCLKGVRSQAGLFKVDQKLRARVNFQQVNLMQPLPTGIGKFDVIFLRNVLIYFDQDTKKQVVERLATALKPGGYFFVSHSESLHRITDQLQSIKPSIYRKP
ncbi:MAG: protein-glutamate O-methyltransferase CheR [Methylicorpusculum sp.]|uniref:CheR family methyltransferase n=1 Tax=Methylicorpusculum sp. TaxID=2713644 RepID=UPI00271E71BA|nr:protein-glutamate O-methyltransferase CheR [Methylicorpusculum sp.]MDO8941275.1 protein-glutamate O-methyltransferase CheR [Methylicorpusculum sp.]MDP2204260.1 protein-glutamate O-methyltransferase CheR [Methylicorpusculum sp.]